jgi:glycerophosphoryl diester phosphodiesterase
MTSPSWTWASGTLATAALSLGSGCGLMDAAGTPVVVAHRAGAGSFPENSRAAVLGALAAGYRGIEVDLVLTRDLVPVLSHDPWLHATLCTRTDGTPLPERPRTLIRDLTLEELQRNFRCGGVRDPANPDALVLAETHMTFQEMLEAAAGLHPQRGLVRQLGAPRLDGVDGAARARPGLRGQRGPRHGHRS